MAEEHENNVVVSEKGIEILIAKLVPTSQYFERSFEYLRGQIDDVKEGQKDLKKDMDRRFEQVDKRFEQADENQRLFKLDMDRRFEQIDKRFERADENQQLFKADIDRRFEKIDVKLDLILDRVDTKIDAGLRENRAMSFKLFSFAVVFSAISMAGFLAKISGLF